MHVALLEGGLARIQIDEKKEAKLVPDRRRYDEAGKHVLIESTMPKPFTSKIDFVSDDKKTTVKFAETKLVIGHYPFTVDVYSTRGASDVLLMQLNERGFMNIEEQRTKEMFTDQTNANNEAVPQEQEEGLWEESFNGKQDTKPKGPESLALDVTFPGFEHVYGVPQHASRLSLKETRGKSIYGNDASKFYTDPYRLYNLDVFEYDPDSPMAIYGAIPFMLAHRPGATAGFFWLNGAETWIDVTKRKQAKEITTETHWISESGIMDLFLFPGPDAPTIFEQFGRMTGFTAMPQYFAIAYHQCRWNYLSQDDVAEVDANFDKYDIPYDVIWLDIEHTEGKKYFTWDKANFGESIKMVDNLASKGRKLVTIVDPHIKREDNYWVYKEAKDLDLFVKDCNGNEYDGWCWPGSSSWVDFFNPKAVEWHRSNFAYDKYQGTTNSLFIWNDMNEPSVFSGPEITMPKDNIHYGGWEHRDVHNIYGLLYHNATAQGLVDRDTTAKRPFVLSRAFFAGSQRAGAIWTGDNLGTWDHLAGTTAMLLTNSIAGMSFGGADIGGFFGNPDNEMLVRWYQTGAFHPFMRAHAHIDTKRREPWLVGEPHTGMIRDAIRTRYSLLPVWYTAFQQASVNGMPMLRPHFVSFPNDVDSLAIDDQFMIGDSGLLVKPITGPGISKTDVHLTNDGEVYYDYFAPHEVIQTKNKNGESGSTYTVSAPIDRIPVFLRGGSIILRRDRIRRSSNLMKYDPFTAVIALSKGDQHSTGTLYLDDGETFNFEKGDYVLRQFDYQNGVLKSSNIHPKARGKESKGKAAKDFARLRIERLIVLGLAKAPERVTADGKELDFKFTKGSSGHANVLVVKDPAVRIVKGDWEVKLE